MSIKQKNNNSLIHIIKEISKKRKGQWAFVSKSYLTSNKLYSLQIMKLALLHISPFVSGKRNLELVTDFSRKIECELVFMISEPPSYKVHSYEILRKVGRG